MKRELKENHIKFIEKIDPEFIDISKVNRIEFIGKNGREFVKYLDNMSFHLQDDGRTLKIMEENNMNTVEKYRKSGYKIRVSHYRYDNEKNKFVRYSRKNKSIPIDNLDQKGGYTQVDVTDPQGNNSTADAYCHNNDQFNYKLGCRIALGRALKNINQKIIK